MYNVITCMWMTPSYPGDSFQSGPSLQIEKFGFIFALESWSWMIGPNETREVYWFWVSRLI